MHFHNLTDFLHMGGYAVYVWPAYGIVAAVLIGNICRPLQMKRKLIKQLQRKQQLHETR